MKVGAGGLQIQAAQEISLKKQPGQESREEEKRPERVEPVPPGTGVTPSREQVIKAVDKINKFTMISNSHLQFSIHYETKKLVVKVVDEEGEVIRQIPPEEMLEMLARMEDSLGAILDRYI